MEPVGTGIIVAICLLLGTVAGVAAGESSIGLVAGLAAGIIVALALTFWDMRRRR